MDLYAKPGARPRRDHRPLLDYETDAYAQKVIDHAVVGTTVYRTKEWASAGNEKPRRLPSARESISICRALSASRSWRNAESENHLCR